MLSRSAAVLFATSFTLVACSNGPTEPEISSLVEISEFTPATLASMGTTRTPISFVTTFTEECGAFSIRPNGNSGRAKAQLALAFAITGDLVGSSCVYIDASFKSDFGPQDFFTTSGFTITEGCIASRGICGIWEDRLPGKINVDPSIGLVSKNHGVMHGVSGTAAGTRILVESFVECSPPGTGCAEGVLIEPGG